VLAGHARPTNRDVYPNWMDYLQTFLTKGLHRRQAFFNSSLNMICFNPDSKRYDSYDMWSYLVESFERRL